MMGLLPGAIAKSVTLSLKQLRRKAIIYAIAVILCATVYGLVIAGIALLLADEYGATEAVFVLAAVFAALVIALLALSAIWGRVERRRLRRERQTQMLYASAVVTALPMVLKSPKIMALATAGVVAALLFTGRRPRYPDEID
jgi:chromate transport protein ChrA